MKRMGCKEGTMCDNQVSVSVLMAWWADHYDRTPTSHCRNWKEPGNYVFYSASY